MGYEKFLLASTPASEVELATAFQAVRPAAQLQSTAIPIPAEIVDPEMEHIPKYSGGGGPA